MQYLWNKQYEKAKKYLEENRLLSRMNDERGMKNNVIGKVLQSTSLETITRGAIFKKIVKVTCN